MFVIPKYLRINCLKVLKYHVIICFERHGRIDTVKRYTSTTKTESIGRGIGVQMDTVIANNLFVNILLQFLIVGEWFYLKSCKNYRLNTINID